MSTRRLNVILLGFLVPLIGFGVPLHIITTHVQSAKTAVSGCSYVENSAHEALTRSTRCDNPHVEQGIPFSANGPQDPHGGHDVSDDQTVMLRISTSGPCLLATHSTVRDDLLVTVAMPVEDRYLLTDSRPTHALFFQRGPPLG